MDELSGRKIWLNELHPLVKMLVTFAYIVLLVSFGKYDLAGVIRMAVYPAALFVLAELSFTDSLRRLKTVLPLVCFVGIFNPFFDRRVIGMAGVIPVTSGMVSMLVLMLKGVLCVLAAYLLIASTGIDKLCYGLRLLHVPSVLVTQIMLTYRYLSVLLREAGHVTQAYALRAPLQRGVHFRVWGSLAGQMLLRSIDRAKVVYESMLLRGYHGEFYYGNKKQAGKKDFFYAVSWIGIFLLLKKI